MSSDDNVLAQPVTVVKGVGTVLASKLQAAGITTIEDLLYFFPRKYDDYSKVTTISNIKPGNVTIKAAIASISAKHIRRGLHITEAVVDDGTSKTRVVWFNQPYRAQQMAKGSEYYFSGEYGLQRTRYVLQNPAAELAKGLGVSTARIVPVYKESAGLKSHQIRKILHELIPLIKMLPDTLPGSVVSQYSLMSTSDTMQNLHFPASAATLQEAQYRMSFDEVLPLLIASLQNKQDQAGLPAQPIAFSPEVAREFTAALPFTMTGAQRQAAWEICKDIQASHPMNRLLQGDVGSGKTVVAAMAMFLAARSGLQTACMAPTEILATQHANTIESLLKPIGVKVALLVGSTSAKAKATIKHQLAAGKIDVLVGTHAIIQKDIGFYKLGLAVVDEQHRFGVSQRSQLLTHGSFMPHMLHLTATPIPRSLQLTVYGELDVSIIGQLPKGRQPIITKVLSPQARHIAYTYIDSEIAKGRQAYVVCPLVADTGETELKNVEAEHSRLTKSIFKHRKIGLLHGQLKPAEKERVMRQFKDGLLDILISTTVIEVGVDVPNATAMLIEGAERFGLAQLHQLRGRVGRGEAASHCYLIPSSAQAISRRLREMEQSTDGFYLAQKDLELRGPGAIYGTAQHGKLDIRFATLTDTKLLAKIQQAAHTLLKTTDDLIQYKRLYEHVNRYKRLTKLN